jgi:formylglycine-generating enzyme required for sulfatase activity
MAAIPYQPHYEKSHALVIGINDYGELGPLDTAIHDAEGVAKSLKEDLGFEVTLLRDAEASRSAVLSHLSGPLTQTDPDDRVLVYFAGHGLTRRTTTGDEVGMLVPHGVGAGQYHDTIEMDYLVDRSKFISAKHILFVLDACFSGLAVMRTTTQYDRLLEDLMTRRSVQAVAAGQQDQLVADRWGPAGHSIFTGLLLDRLGQPGGLLTGNEMGLYLQRQVGMHTHSRQTPHYGHLLGSQGGDFVFWAEETVVELPADLRGAIENSISAVREGAVRELAHLLEGSLPEMAQLAREALERLAEDDSRKVSAAAQEALQDVQPTAQPAVAPSTQPIPPVQAPTKAEAIPSIVGPPRLQPATKARPTGGGFNLLWIGGGTIGVGVLVGILALAGVFGGGPSPAAEEEPELEFEEEAAPAEEEAVATPVPFEPALTGSDCRSSGLSEIACTGVGRNDEWTPVTQDFNGVEMALVPAGCFMMGIDSEDGISEELPVHEQCFEEPFWIDVTEVTNGQFADFLNEAGNQTEGGATWLDADDEDVHIRQSGETWVPLDGSANHPAIEVAWFGAVAYCEGRGMRLPTEAEWEYAARGPDSLTYPWGNEFVAANAVYESNSGGQSAEVGSRPGGVSWVGAYDMSGNVSEWASSIYEPYPYDGEDGREVDGSGDGSSDRVLRGGSWTRSTALLPAANRVYVDPDFTYHDLGFRCARSF